MESIINIKHVTATYGRGSKRFTALDDVSLEIGKGQIFGLLGPNGAGKTTLLSCIEALHKPESGDVKVAGLIPMAAKAKLVHV